MSELKQRLPTAALALASVAIFVASCLVGPANLSIANSLGGLFDDSRAGVIVREIRMPRALAAWLAGAALGASGAAMQGLLRNPLADPGVLGVSSMAALGAVIAIYFNISAAAHWATPIAAIFFALGATVVLHAFGAGRLSPSRLILVGVGLSSFAGALIALVMNLRAEPFHPVRPRQLAVRGGNEPQL